MDLPKIGKAGRSWRCIQHKKSRLNVQTAFSWRGAEGGTRTPTGVNPLAPQASVSTNSTTSALHHPDLLLGRIIRCFSVLHRISRSSFYGFRFPLSSIFFIISHFFFRRGYNGGWCLCRRWRRGIENDGLFGGLVLGRTHICEGQRGDKKDRSGPSGEFGQETTGPATPEKGGAPTTEDDPHALLARLQKDENNQCDTCDNMDGNNQ